MRTRHIAAFLLAACLPLAACGGTDKSSGKAASDKPAASKKVDCSDTNLSQADWVKHCQGAPPQGEQSVDTSQDRPLGKAAETIGSPSPVSGPGGGVLEILPTSVVYVTKGTGQEPARDLFGVVAYKAKSTKAVAAAESAPIEGGGWKWVASDGEAVDTLSGNTATVTPDGYGGGGAIQPGTFEWRAVSFDLSKAQQGGP
jgi:hypothetical protein